MNNLRKFFAVSIMTLTVIAMSGVIINPAQAAVAGDLIKSPTNSAVYYLGADGKRYVFPNPDVYFSWYKDFSGVTTISATELASYPLGGNVVMRAGTKLVKITTDPSVYAVEPNGVLRKISSESAAVALYGSNWAKRVVDVADSYFTNYTIGNVLGANEVPKGSLVKNASSATVYYYDGVNYRIIASDAAMTANRFKAADIITLTGTITGTGAQITGQEDALVKTSQNSASSAVVSAGTGLSVSLASNTAAASSLIATQSSASMTSINLTASNDGAVTLTSIKVKRTGVSSDAYLSNVYLYDGNNKLTDPGSLSGGYVTFSNASGIVTIPAGTTKTITVKADISSSGTTGNIAMGIDAAADINAAGATVSGSFPVTGNLMSLMATPSDMATVVVGALTIPSANANVNAGTMNSTVWSAPFTVNNKATYLKYMSFKQVGSIPSDALQNLKLYVNGTQAGSAASIVDNRVIFDLNSAPVLLSTGATTVELRADVIKGSSRTFSFNVQLASDMVLTDSNYNVNVTATGAINTNTYTYTVASGTISTSADSTFTTNQVVKNATGVTFAKYTMKAYGENMKVNSLGTKITFTGTAAATEGINNLAIYVNGSQVGSTQNFVLASGVFPTGAGVTGTSLLGGASFGTNNLFTIPAGTTVTVEVKGDLTQVSSSALSTVKADLILQATKAEGQSSYATYPATAVTTLTNQTMSIVNGALTVATNSSFTSQNVINNVNNQKIGSFILQTGSAESVDVSNLAVTIGGTLVDFTTLSNLYVSENTSPIMPQSGANNFPVSFNIPVNGTKTIDVFADLGNISAGTTSQVTLAVTAVGHNTRTSVSGSKAGQILTIQSGSLAAPTLVTNAPASQLLLGGTTQTVATYKFVANNGAATISELWFSVVKNVTTTQNTSTVASLTVGGVNAPVIVGAATSTVHITGLNLVVPAGNTGLQVPVSAVLSNITSAGMGGANTNDQLRLVLTDYKYTIGSTNTLGSTAVNGGSALAVPSALMMVVGAYPVVTLASNNPAGMSTGYTGSGASDLLHFTVTNGSSMPINFNSLTYTPIFSDSTLTSTSSQKVKIYDQDDLVNALNGSGWAIGNSGTATTTTFTTDSVIPANSSKTYVVKVDTTGTWDTAGKSIRMDLTSADTLLTGTNWQWNDSTISGYINGYLVKNLPLTGNTFVK